MIMSKKLLKNLEEMHRCAFPRELKRYLLVKYSEEPFPYEYSEQDLYANLKNDIRDYGAGILDTTIKSLSERQREKIEYLKSLCVEKLCEINDLEVYVFELESILYKHDLQSSRMMERRLIKY